MSMKYCFKKLILNVLTLKKFELNTYSRITISTTVLTNVIAIGAKIVTLRVQPNHNLISEKKSQQLTLHLIFSNCWKTIPKKAQEC